MKELVLLTTRRINSSLVIMDGEKEVAAVFGSPKVQELRSVELISGANLLRQLRASRANVIITKGKIQQ